MGRLSNWRSAYCKSCSCLLTWGEQVNGIRYCARCRAGGKGR